MKNKNHDSFSLVGIGAGVILVLFFIIGFLLIIGQWFYAVDKHELLVILGGFFIALIVSYIVGWITMRVYDAM